MCNPLFFIRICAVREKEISHGSRVAILNCITYFLTEEEKKCLAPKMKDRSGSKQESMSIRLLAQNERSFYPGTKQSAGCNCKVN